MLAELGPKHQMQVIGIWSSHCSLLDVHMYMYIKTRVCSTQWPGRSVEICSYEQFSSQAIVSIHLYSI